MAVKNDGDDIFVDSSFFCAFYNPKDTLHTRAISLAKKLRSSKARLWISNYIFLEVVTIISQRVGKKESVVVGGKIKNIDFVSNIHTDESLHQLSWELFKQITNKNISFIDVAIIKVMEQEGINLLVTFDAELAKLAKFYKIKALS